MSLSSRQVVISSCVGGGPMERLARRLNERGTPARVLAGYAPERWRSMMAAGTFGRLQARFGAMAVFPLRTLLDALFRRGAVLVPTTNPFFLPLLLVATRPLHGQVVVPLVYDLYPDALEASGMARGGGLLSRLAEMANRFLFSRADGVVFIGSRMAAHAKARYGEPRRWTVLETGADTAEMSGGDAESQASDLERWCEGKTVLAYVGNMGIVHDWETLAAAVPLLLRDGPTSAAVVIAASGPGVAYLREAWREVSPDRVRFEPPLDDVPWARLLRRTALSVVTLRDAARHTSIPSKTFSAMAAGSAIVAVAPRESDVADVVERHGCGLLFTPGDPAEVAAGLAALVADRPRLSTLREAARTAAHEHYDMPVLAGRWEAFLTSLPPRQSLIGRGAKRLLDTVASGLGLLLLSPLLILVAALVRKDLGTPVLFRQERPGRGGHPFKLMKFRSMRDPRPGEEGPEADAARLTRLGRFIRATSIDELPTLLNVLKGDMSLVGPRPLLMRYLPRYTARQARRHEVKPGITGWAQVNGRNAISWEQKFEFDVWYVDHRSFWLDLRILLLTAAKVFRREGISREGHATMPEFTGADKEKP